MAFKHRNIIYSNIRKNLTFITLFAVDYFKTPPKRSLIYLCFIIIQFYTISKSFTSKVRSFPARG